jgi:hypothetical protein
MAIVEYEHPLEAVQAVSMFNEQQLYDRIMAVKIDLKDEGKDDGRPMKLPSKKQNFLIFKILKNILGGLKSIGVGLGIAGNPLRTGSKKILFTKNKNIFFLFKMVINMNQQCHK